MHKSKSLVKASLLREGCDENNQSKSITRASKSVHSNPSKRRGLSDIASWIPGSDSIDKLSLNLGISDISISPSSYSCNLTHIKALELLRKMYFQMKLINQEGVIILDPGESLILGLVFHVISMICLHRAFVSHTWLDLQWTVGVGDRGRPEVPASDKNKHTKRWGSLVFSQKRNGFDKAFSAVTNINW